MTAFFPCLENLKETEFNSNGLMCLAEKMSWQDTIHFMTWVVLLSPGLQWWDQQRQTFKKCVDCQEEELNKVKVAAKTCIKNRL